jgi:hypothetical protein
MIDPKTFKPSRRWTTSWPIVRTSPIGRTYGLAIPVFISNALDCSVTALGVYADGCAPPI